MHELSHAWHQTSMDFRTQGNMKHEHTVKQGEAEKLNIFRFSCLDSQLQKSRGERQTKKNINHPLVEETLKNTQVWRGRMQTNPHIQLQSVCLGIVY